jgi:hypothetical protein
VHRPALLPALAARGQSRMKGIPQRVDYLENVFANGQPRLSRFADVYADRFSVL